MPPPAPATIPASRTGVSSPSGTREIQEKRSSGPTSKSRRRPYSLSCGRPRRGPLPRRGSGQLQRREQQAGRYHLDRAQAHGHVRAQQLHVLAQEIDLLLELLTEKLNVLLGRERGAHVALQGIDHRPGLFNRDVDANERIIQREREAHEATLRTERSHHRVSKAMAISSRLTRKRPPGLTSRPS